MADIDPLDFKKFTSLFLYGTVTPPPEIFDRIRPANAPIDDANVNVLDFMHSDNSGDTIRNYPGSRFRGDDGTNAANRRRCGCLTSTDKRRLRCEIPRDF
jgi:hypothetical protein